MNTCNVVQKSSYFNSEEVRGRLTSLISRLALIDDDSIEVPTSYVEFLNSILKIPIKHIIKITNSNNRTYLLYTSDDGNKEYCLVLFGREFCLLSIKLHEDLSYEYCFTVGNNGALYVGRKYKSRYSPTAVRPYAQITIKSGGFIKETILSSF